MLLKNLKLSIGPVCKGISSSFHHESSWIVFFHMPLVGHWWHWLHWWHWHLILPPKTIRISLKSSQELVRRENLIPLIHTIWVEILVTVD